MNGEIRRIEHLIFAAKLRGALEEARRLDARAHDLAAEMREPIARVVALKLMLAGETMNAVQSRGDKAVERLIGEAIGNLSRFKMPEIGGDPANLSSFIFEWREMLSMTDSLRAEVAKAVEDWQDLRKQFADFDRDLADAQHRLTVLEKSLSALAHEPPQRTQ